MTQRIITGYVDTASGRDALALAEVLADIPPGSELLITRVYAYNPPEEPETPVGWRKALRDRADAELAGARERFAGREGTIVRPSCGLSEADGLHRLASTEDALAVVVGVSHAHGLERIRSGSVTEQTIQGSPCPVAIAPPGYADAPAPLKTVAVAYNGSDEARHALQIAAAIAYSAGAALRIVGVVEPGAVWYTAYGGPGATADLGNVVRTELEAAAARVEGIDDVEVRVLTGEPVRAIGAATADADLLVLGSRGYGPLRRVLLGSVSSKLIRHPSCPLLVLPRSAVATEPAEGEVGAP